jgi:hypothetical protein
MIKKITELTEGKPLKKDIVPFVDTTNGTTKKAVIEDLLNVIVPSNAGGHNAIYRGKDITEYFYGREKYNEKTFSQAVADGTFDNIFVGDYIIGKTSNRKYLVADINYRLHCGDTECKTPHVLIIPERIMGTAKMNDTNITTGAYIGSKMYTEYLAPFKTIIQNDFENSHILSHREYFPNAVTNGYESAGAWVDSTIELMNELMVYGSNIFHNITNGTNIPTNHTIDKSQLSLFRLKPSEIVALNDAGERYWYWLRDVVSSSGFATVSPGGDANYNGASASGGVRPAFLIY